LPILDHRELTDEQINDLISLYDQISDETLLPIKNADDDTRELLDTELAGILNISDYSILRNLLAREPVICLHPLV
jgi:hypothetical protein